MILGAVVSSVTLAMALGTVGVVGCRRAPPPPAPKTVGSASTPVDRLAPGEAPPGVELAYDLQLPRGAVIEARFGTTVHASVPLPPEQVATFVQQQTNGVEAVMGPNGTIFPNLRVKGADPDHHLRVEISTGSMSNGTKLIVDRIEEREPPAPMDPEEVMKKAGLNPQGGLLDPNHTE
jgi:hypothetical protein